MRKGRIKVREKKNAYNIFSQQRKATPKKKKNDKKIPLLAAPIQTKTSGQQEWSISGGEVT